MNERDLLLEKYSSRVFKNRKSHITQLEMSDEQDTITANTRAIPGIATARGCCYAGCKGVVVGPMKDAVTITHGPIGCAFYSWGTRRNKAKTEEGGKNFIPYSFCTDMRPTDIVFGGEKKLEEGIDEIMAIFNPKCIFICSTCPIGLIGDDVQAVAREVEKKYGIKAIGFSCEGYKGVSQSSGHHIANNGLMKQVIGTGDKKPMGKYSLNILGEYNIGGDGWEEERILKKIGYEIVSVFTGDGSYETMKNAHLADLNLVMCHRSINYVAQMMKTKYGIDWLKVNFIGIGATCKTLRMIAEYFQDTELIAKTEEVIAQELEAISDDMEYYRSMLKGKTAGIFTGGSRSHHYQSLLRDLGIETIIAGYEFAHRDDYEGRDIISEIKPDADSKNIEEIAVSRDEELYKERYSGEKLEELKEKGIEIDTYDGMFPDMKKGYMVVDDYNMFETDELIQTMKPDIFFSGIKDKYSIQKQGVVSRQLHSYDYSGPYAGFNGAVIFGRDVTMSIYTKAWVLTTPPWKTAALLGGRIGGEN
ncbi:nitrogenase component I subunit alpha [Anaerocolumna xylanovorans]|uniref:Nitrogenase protein alpha chain n=1 Tax=Anaerocolumna xylanovorans DSM 12503 TaxID=1121345 RepID=A0A1M7YHW4_9FIRM|nr:nitrogenase component I subunit alpha [Anaerocolumna xylanovorans]SHO52191.1 nitrogenase molybdenum-iron protein alpha chain [Anaerocolumna xylanovorans DSM 12503]